MVSHRFRPHLQVLSSFRQSLPADVPVKPSMNTWEISCILQIDSKHMLRGVTLSRCDKILLLATIPNALTDQLSLNHSFKKNKHGEKNRAYSIVTVYGDKKPAWCQPSEGSQCPLLPEKARSTFLSSDNTANVEKAHVYLGSSCHWIPHYFT